MIGSALGGIVGGIASLTTGGGGMDSYQQAKDLLMAVKDPSFDFSKLTPAQLQVVAELDPVTYRNVVAPKVQQLQDSPEMRSAQAGALSQMQQIGQEGLPAQDRLLAQEARDKIMSAQRNASLGAIRGLQERGRIGGGSEIQARLGAGQQSAELARGLGSDLQRQAIQNRLAGIDASANMAGSIRGQDVDASQKAAEIINRYNMWDVGNQNQAAMYNAQAQNQAQALNAQNRQGIANQNVANTYANNARNQEYPNQLQAQLADFRLKKAGAQAGALNAYGQAQDAERAGKINAIGGIAGGVGSIADVGVGALGGGGGLLGGAGGSAAGGASFNYNPQNPYGLSKDPYGEYY